MGDGTILVGRSAPEWKKLSKKEEWVIY